MDDAVVLRIKNYLTSHPPLAYFPPVPETTVTRAESELGFSIPALLKSLYLQVGNGVSGFGYEIMGLEGGCRSDFGNLVETYRQLKGDQELEGREWRRGLLPFCAWGCNIFSCVDCTEDRNSVYTFDDFEVWPQEYTLHDFFEMWVREVDILAQEKADKAEVEITNPFTGERTRVTRRRRK